MILVLAGTSEGRQVVEKLTRQGRDVAASVVSEHGAEMLAPTGACILCGRKDFADLKRLFGRWRIELVVDATHPFAAEISENAMDAARACGVRYVRLERAALNLPAEPAEGEAPQQLERPERRLIRVRGFEAAAAVIGGYGRALLTTGSRSLEHFATAIAARPDSIVIRILPDWRHLRRVQELGLPLRNIVAMQGPFGVRMNEVLIADYGVDVLVSKASGRSGGLAAKIEAACRRRIPVVIIERPRLEYPEVYSSVDELCREL